MRASHPSARAARGTARGVAELRKIRRVIAEAHENHPRENRNHTGFSAIPLGSNSACIPPHRRASLSGCTPLAKGAGQSPHRPMPGRADRRAAMAAGVEERRDRLILVAQHDNRAPRDRKREIVPRLLELAIQPRKNLFPLEHALEVELVERGIGVEFLRQRVVPLARPAGLSPNLPSFHRSRERIPHVILFEYGPRPPRLSRPRLTPPARACRRTGSWRSDASRTPAPSCP